MGLVQEFKDFIIKGNAIDLAVGLIIGAAFGAVVTSLVTDVVMPPIGAAMGGVDFSKLSIPIVKAVAAGEKHPVTGLVVDKDIAAVGIGYGKFLNALIALLIQGFAVFMIVKVIQSMKKKEAVAPSSPPPPTKDQALLTEIRDLLSRR